MNIITYLLFDKMFPLFNQLYSTAIDKDLSPHQKKNLLVKIEQINQEGMNLLYVLIITYQINVDNLKSPYPYESEGMNDITFNLDLLPVKLKQIIYKFVNMHLKRQQEEEFKTNNYKFDN